MRGIQTLAASAILILAQACFGQTSTNSLPTVDQILAKALDAGGGKAAYDKLTTRMMDGTVEIPGLPTSASWEMRGKVPNKMWMKIEVGGSVASIEGCDGQVAWTKNPMSGVSEKKGEELAKALRDADFSEVTLKKTFPDIAVKGSQKLGDMDVYVLESKPSPTSRELFYFDAKGGLCVRRDSEFQLNDKIISAEISLGDYRTVDGIKVPYSVKIKASVPDSPSATMTLKVQTVKHNIPVNDELFKKP